MISDSPITRSQDDKIGFAPLAQRMCESLIDWPKEEGVVVGLYGPWGAGKSSFLRLLESFLRALHTEESPVVVVQFNPWLHGDSISLLEGFFGSLRDAIGGAERRIGRQAAEAIGELAKAAEPYLVAATAGSIAVPLAAIRGIGVYRAAQSERGHRNLEMARRVAKSRLAELGNRVARWRVIVTIDDLDRLDSGDLRVVLKVVRAVADLPGVTYVLAMDPLECARILSPEEPRRGQAYLEKIVQLGVFIPELTAERLKPLVMEALTDELQSEPFQRSSVLQGESPTYERTLGRRIRNLRDRARLINAVRFFARTGMRRREYDADDLVLLAFLQAFYPEVVQRVRRRRAFLTRDFGLSEAYEWASRRDEDQQKEIDRQLRWLVGGDGPVSLPAEEEEAVRQCLRSLFYDALTGRQVSANEARVYRVANRMRAPSRFDRYFLLTPIRSEVGNRVVGDLVKELGLAVASAASLEGLLEQAIRRQAVGLDRLHSLVEGLADATALASWNETAAILMAGARLRRETERQEVEDLLSAALARLVALSSPEDGPDRAAQMATAVRALEHFAECCDDIPLVVDLLADVGGVEKARADVFGEGFPDVVLRSAKRVLAAAAQVGLFKRYGLYDAVRTLHGLRRMSAAVGRPIDDLREYLRGMVEREPSRLPDVLALVAAWSMEEVPQPHIGRYETAIGKVVLEEVFGWEEVVRRVREFEGVSGDDPYGLVDQFKSVYLAGS